MRRRDFIKVIANSIVIWPLAAHAQQSDIPVVGFLSATSSRDFARLATAFRGGLRQNGYVEGRNMIVVYRWAEGRYDRLPTMASELVQRPVNVIVAVGGIPSALAAKQATATIPIVFNVGEDPVKLGLVASITQPHGNATGVRVFTGERERKRLELLLKLVPKTTVVAMLVNPLNPAAVDRLREAQTAARVLGQQIKVLRASTEREIDTAFATLAQQQAGALIIANDAYFNARYDQLVTLAARHAIPAIYSHREHATAGGLLSYATNLADAYRQVGFYTGRVLNGAKPNDLPILQPNKFELVINLNTAKTLGLKIPDELLALADEVIE